MQSLVILFRHQDLMVPGEGVQKTQALAPCRGIDDEVDPQQRERVLGAGLVQVCEVDAETPLEGQGLWHHHGVGHPCRVRDRPDDTCFYQLVHL